MMQTDLQLSQLHEARRHFASLVAEIRPELHRYCARMTGSVIDGEDVVQDTLARAFYELSALKELPKLRAWLFRIAHNRALDYLRRYDRRMVEPFDEQLNERSDVRTEPDEMLTRSDAVVVALAHFLELPPIQRSCVVLKDVLDCSLSEIADLLDASVAAVKAALHRGRDRLRQLALIPEQVQPAPPVTPAVQRYAELFNARAWDGVRAMLVSDVQLDVVDGTKRSGREKVGIYFTNYDKLADWRMVPAWLDGREGLAVVGPSGAMHIRYFVVLTVRGSFIAGIRDFHHVPYFSREAAYRLPAVS